MVKEPPPSTANGAKAAPPVTEAAADAAPPDDARAEVLERRRARKRSVLATNRVELKNTANSFPASTFTFPSSVHVQCRSGMIYRKKVSFLPFLSLPSFSGFYWVSPSFTGFYLVLLGFT